MNPWLDVFLRNITGRKSDWITTLSENLRWHVALQYWSHWWYYFPPVFTRGIWSSKPCLWLWYYCGPFQATLFHWMLKILLQFWAEEVWKTHFISRGEAYFFWSFCHLDQKPCFLRIVFISLWPKMCLLFHAALTVFRKSLWRRQRDFSISSVAKNLVALKKHLMNGCFCQIIALNKTKERMRPYQGNQEDEDPDIKKIKKVNMQYSVFERRKMECGRLLVYFSLSSFAFRYCLIKYAQLSRCLLTWSYSNHLNYINLIYFSGYLSLSVFVT